MKKIRDEFDYHGGRAIGSREMLDIRDAEYGGEMLYINKSAHHPMWAMEYCRDEGCASIGIITPIHIMRMEKETVLIILRLPEKRKNRQMPVYTIAIRTLSPLRM